MTRQIELLLDVEFGKIIQALKNADKVLHDTSTVVPPDRSVCGAAAEALEILIKAAEGWRQDSIILDFIENRVRFTNGINGKSYWTFTLAHSPRNPDNVGDWEDLRDITKRTMDEEID